jgi:hypothetical protein
MTRLGMVVLGLTAAATAIALGVGIAVAPSQETTPATALTPAQMAEMKSSPVPAKVRPAPLDDEEDGGALVVPQDGEGEDGPGS